MCRFLFLMNIKTIVERMRPYSDIMNMRNLDNITQEELFGFWIQEAISLGIVLEFLPEKDIPPFKIFDGLSYEYIEEKVVYEGTSREEIREKVKKHKLLEPARYTPDGIIVWNPKVKDILFNDLFVKGEAYFKAQFNEGKWFSIIDVKAPKGVNRISDTPFMFTRKMMWQSHNLFVNKVMNIPPKPGDKGYLFKEVWTPMRYFMTDKLTKKRAIRYKAIDLLEFSTKNLQNITL